MPKARIPAVPAGTKFGAWTVLGEAGLNRHGGTMVLARCDCGTERTLTQSNLRLGMTKSCGGPAHRKQLWVTR